jgi:hypothetical protein
MPSNNVKAKVPNTCLSLSAPAPISRETPQNQYAPLSNTLRDKSTSIQSQPKHQISSSTPNPVPTRPILFKVPIEVRYNIYAEIFLEGSSNGIIDGTDSLTLQAFSLNSQLYYEALTIYWKLNTLLLNRDTLQNFKHGLPNDYLSYVTSLRLEIE